MDDVSVYQNIDRDLYKEDGSVAMTDAAQRANNTAAGTTGTEKEQMDALAIITAISWAATAGCVFVTLGALIKRSTIVRPLTNGAFNDVFETAIYGSYDEYYTVRKMLTPSAIDKVDTARYAVHLSRIVMVATLAVAVISTVLTIIYLCRDKSIEQLPIPKYLVDNYTDTEGGSYTLNYKTVECNRAEFFGEGYTRQKGSSADLNADEGKQWLVLYTSKNSKAGKPLTPDFVIQKSNQAPGGYEGGVHLIGEKGAVNVVSSAFKKYSTFSQTWQSIVGDCSMYIFTKLSNDVKTYDEAFGNMTASSFNSGMAALFGFGGAAVGAILGALGASFLKKKKKTAA